MARNPESAFRAVLIYDGYLTIAGNRMDVLMVEAVQFGPEHASLTIAVAYRHASDPAGFAVYRPKFTKYQGPELSFQKLGTVFFMGVDQHYQGSAIWDLKIDESQ